MREKRIDNQPDLDSFREFISPHRVAYEIFAFPTLTGKAVTVATA